jgi:GNAT superfamily N-acetyltransferase
VIGVVRHSETLEPLVLYRPLYEGSDTWVRPHAMFFGSVEVDGQVRPRFARIEAAPARAAGTGVRPVRPEDRNAWRPLWDGYNAFYGRAGATALPEAVTASTWRRFLDPAEPVHALVAEADGRVAGLAHYLFHRSTNRIEPVCYLQDLFTEPASRGRGIGRRLVEAVVEAARAAGSRRVYWQTQAGNAAGRALYDKVAKHHGFIVYSREL